MEEILKIFNQNKDEGYAEFQSKLIPTIDKERVYGVRTPVLRKLAKVVVKSSYCEDFLLELPHTYFEENQLHGFVISEIKDFNKCIYEVERFLPYIDNWATCDQTSPKVFKKNKDKLISYINKWINDDRPYTVRFAIGMLMTHFLDEDFDTKYVDMVVHIRSDEYYVNMEIAWYLATALAKKWDYVVPYIESKKLDKWVQNKTIQKAKESFRINNEQKEYLKTLKIN